MTKQPTGKNFVMIEWGDAYGTADTEQREDEISHEAAHFISWGWLIRSNEKGVTIAAEWSPSGNTYRSVMFIPRGMIDSEKIVSKPTRPIRQRKKRIPQPVTTGAIREGGSE